MELARGKVEDRPWGKTLGALALRGLTGQLILVADGKKYQIAFRAGAVVGAHSPLASDAAARLALTSNLVSSTQVAEIVREVAANPGKDEIEILVERARLTPEQALRLRRRTVAQRAARTFSIDRGEFVVVDETTLVTIPGSELDARAVVYIGARQNLSEARLASELGQIGEWFQLKQEAVEDLAQFGFGETERTLLERLLIGGDLVELEETGDQRTVRAAIYSLACCNACNVEPVPRNTGRGQNFATLTPARGIRRGASSSQPPTKPISRTGRGSDPPSKPGIPLVNTRASATDPPTTKPASGPLAIPKSGPIPLPTTGLPKSGPISIPTGLPKSTTGPLPNVTKTGSGPIPRPGSTSTNAPTTPRASFKRPATAGPPADDEEDEELLTFANPAAVEPPSGVKPRLPPATQPIQTRVHTASMDPPTTRRRVMGTASPDQVGMVKKLIDARIKLIEQRADHFALLGVGREAETEEIRTAYFALARMLHPDKLASMGISDDGRNAHRVFAQVNAAFAAVGDAGRRFDYLRILARGGEDAVRAEQQAAEELALRALEAEECYRRGEMALRRDQLSSAINEFKRASELDPETADYQGMLAWAKFCASPDKMAAAGATRFVLEKAVTMAPKAPTSRFLLGRVERMIGRDAEALKHFKDVLKVAPGHADASSELRVIEARIAQAAAKKK